MKGQKTTPEEREALKEQRSHIKRTIPRHQLQAEWNEAIEQYEAARIRVQEVIDRIKTRSDPDESPLRVGDKVEDTIYGRRGVILSLAGFMAYGNRVGANYSVDLDDEKLILHETLLRKLS